MAAANSISFAGANAKCTSTPTSGAPNPKLPRSAFLTGRARRTGWQLRASTKDGRRRGATCWFKFGKNGMDSEGAGIYGSQSRDDFDRDDVEQYFNYMGMLATEGTYDKMNALLDQKIHPVDILLLMASSEADRPKIEELMKAGAKCDVKDADGRTALDRAPNDEIRELILSLSLQKV